MIDLKTISDTYQKNLIEFFNNDEIIDIIYKEQYGEDYYSKHKEECKDEYKKILSQTIFMPYITLPSLENFIESAKKERGENYVNNNLKDEKRLLTRLCAERDKIISSYSSTLFEELQKINPRLNNVDLSKALCDETNKEQTLTDVDLIVSNLKNILNTSKRTFHPFKTKKIIKLVNDFQKDTKEKILVETSTYFKHKADTMDKKDYVPIIENLSKGRPVRSKIF